MATQPPSLIHVDDRQPGITRKRAGRGWAYYMPGGRLIRDAGEKRRLNAIALPPAYRDAWFCTLPNGHILATGVDARGRKQYRYHPDYRLSREAEKFDACRLFGEKLPLVRARVEEDLQKDRLSKDRLSKDRLSKDRTVASVVRLLDLGAVRVGNELYTRENRSFGATTLRGEHARLKGSTLTLRYTGKGGKLREVELSDAALACCVRALHDLPGQRLFQWIGEDGETHDVNSACVNDYLRETMGEHFSAKHFRTWHASEIGFALLADAKERLSIKQVIEHVAQRLGNTPAVTRKSYVHPAVIDLVNRQENWRDTLQLPRRTRWLTRVERGLLELLGESPGAAELLAA